jgi:hypothetical protein
MFLAIGCIHCGIKVDDSVLCCVQEHECLCLRSSGCLAIDVPDRGIGLVTEEDECCKLGFYCCNYGLVWPQVLCKGVEQILCIRRAYACPCHPDYVPEFVCAYYGLQCAPNCGCCAPGPDSPALNRLVGKVQPALNQLELNSLGKAGYAPAQTQEEMERPMV